MTYYSGITIGPLIKTISQQRRVRSIFAASYIFSDLARYILQQLVALDSNLGVKILSPTVKYLNKTDPPKAGFYPDRILIQSQISIKDEIDQIIINAKTCHLFGLLDEKVDKTVISQYFNIHHIEMKTSEQDALDQTIIQLSQMLDAVEYQNTYASLESFEIRDHIGEVQVNSPIIKSAFLRDGEHPGKVESMISLPAIASHQLHDLLPNEYDELLNELAKKGNDEDDLYAQIRTKSKNKSLLKALRKYHSYVAIVHADGDNMGSKIPGLLKSGELSVFNEFIWQYGRKVMYTLEEYGATPIYIGGDDIFFIAPVMVGKEDKQRHIFDLIKTLDDTLEQQKTISKRDSTYPWMDDMSISYGVQISYYKHPLGQAVLDSLSQLNKSKIFEIVNKDGAKIKKNAISVALKLGSGQVSTLSLGKSKSSQFYDQFIALLQSSMQMNKDEDYLSGLTHDILEFQHILSNILTFWHEKLEDNLTRQLLENFMTNSFNESVHKESDYLWKLTDFIYTYYEEYHAASNSSNQDWVDEVNQMLRTIAFFTPIKNA